MRMEKVEGEGRECASSWRADHSTLVKGKQEAGRDGLTGSWKG